MLKPKLNIYIQIVKYSYQNLFRIYYTRVGEHMARVPKMVFTAVTISFYFFCPTNVSIL